MGCPCCRVAAGLRSTRSDRHSCSSPRPDPTSTSPVVRPLHSVLYLLLRHRQPLRIDRSVTPPCHPARSPGKHFAPQHHWRVCKSASPVGGCFRRHWHQRAAESTSSVHRVVAQLESSKADLTRIRLLRLPQRDPHSEHRPRAVVRSENARRHVRSFDAAAQQCLYAFAQTPTHIRHSDEADLATTQTSQREQPTSSNNIPSALGYLGSTNAPHCHRCLTSRIADSSSPRSPSTDG